MQDRTNHYRALLDTCIEADANIIRILNQEAEAEAHTRTAEPAASLTPRPDIATAYTRVHRAVRLGILLAQSLDHPPKPPQTATRARVIRAVEDCIQREIDPPEATRLHAELRERLDTESFDIDVRTRPVEDVIQDIIRDLGFDRICGTHPYKRRTPADLALLEITAAVPKGQAANPAHTPTWRLFPADEDDGLPQILQTILNPTRFRGK